MTLFNEEELKLKAYADGLAESVPKDAPESDFADPPKGLYVGDKEHVGYAVQAVTQGFRGNKAEARSEPGVKSKIASAINKFYSGKEKEYYLSWLHTGKKPDEKSASEMKRLHEIRFTTPTFTPEDERKFPQVPFSPAFDLTGLKEHYDPNPKFVTRPLGILNEISDNNLKYNAEMLDEIYQQVMDKRLPARLGHVSEADRSWRVPPSDAYWVGALDDPGTVFDNRTIFGIAYIRPGTDLREMISVQEFTGTPISNSAWGEGNQVDNDDGTVSFQQMEIESIDFVPPERAALKALGGDFEVTSEMKEGAMTEEHSDAAADLALFKNAVASIKPENVQDVHDMLHEAGHAHGLAEAHVRMHEMGDKCSEGKLHELLSREGRAKVAETHLREEASPEESYKMLSEASRKHVAECYAKEMGTTLSEETKTKEEESKKAMSEMNEMNSRISELEKENKAYKRKEFEQALDSRVNTYFTAEVRTDKGKTTIATLKARIRKDSLVEMAGMADGQTLSNIAVACDKAWEENKPLVEMAYAGLQGPDVVTGEAHSTPGGAVRMGIDPATGRFTPDFMKTAKQAAAGAVRTTPRKKE